MAKESKARRATIEDVAEAAGVSRAAVSKVLRNAYGVSPKMKAKVLATIEQLDYRPLVAARAMSGASYTVGIEIPDFRNQFFTKVLSGAKDALKGTGYQLIIAPADEGPKEGHRALEALLDRQVDGVIAVSPLVGQSWLERAAERTPMVMFARHDRSLHYDTVAGDDVAGADAVMQHLLELGHQRIAHLTRDEMVTEPGTPHGLRLGAYLKVMVEAGLADSISVTRCGEGQDLAYAATQSMLAAPEPPTAIFAGHDELALGALRAVVESGLDISVAGYDDVPLASHPLISLTSVDQPGAAMGARAVRMLLERLAGRTDAFHETFVPMLRTRKSTRPPANEALGNEHSPDVAPSLAE
ncbi:LacI family DNA-binding transcriptional regulator [Paenarthrobacter sp. A20]|uniref:LacI family DNA-binding transcriptional regulator n=1 Tax=Paenarthrobacter sp. A20 TaxID=2817891 RepID=UPI00209C770F|nr:LacI family DNA-binding transcriptional regulator [Paenarthrobacter sp. A20]MCP1415563.1 LacI family transcriptional regulator [Paenarthrobacter sp. A20]